MTRRYSEPASRECIERGCHEPAGTPWGPNWCARHDVLRLDRITRQLNDIASDLAGESSPNTGPST